MKLKEIIEELKINNLQIVNNKDIEISGISYDSRETKPGDLFVCIKGEHLDSHNFAFEAFKNGAVAFLCQRELIEKNISNAVQIIVDYPEKVMADICSILYNYPSKDLNLIGITGTNGKTTVAHLIQYIIENSLKNDQKCGLIGTLGYKMSCDDIYHCTCHTTPQAPELQLVLNQMRLNNLPFVAMEVSSHSLEQNRIGGCSFKAAVFTNLTQDHLDYHITMNNYFNAKALLFKNLSKNDFAIINNDDEYAEKFINILPDNGVKLLTYGVKKESDVTAKDIRFNSDGVLFTCVYKNENIEFKLKLNGMFNVYNALSAIATTLCFGFDIQDIRKSLSEVENVPGRFEVVNKDPLVIVDYAHTPDGLKNVLNAASDLKQADGKLICLFGCGGDRDATKRPKMAHIADSLADKVVITSDNPRSEDPNAIISDIMSGISSINTDHIFVEPDRAKAIKFLRQISNKNDIIVVAGKGHEDYQILADKTIHFDDKEHVQNVFSAKILK